MWSEFIKRGRIAMWKKFYESIVFLPELDSERLAATLREMTKIKPSAKKGQQARVPARESRKSSAKF
jgi:hypothetical protein